MFGIYRYLLAWMVVYTHARGFIDGRLNWFGPYAVNAFYMLSGYLMTLVLVERYNRLSNGFPRYLFNRTLRIYPTYWAALVLTAAYAFFDPVATTTASIFYRLPTDAYSWFLQVVIVGLHGDVLRVVAPAWTLSVELIFYAAMGLLLSRSRIGVILWLVTSLIWTGVQLFHGRPIYFTVHPVLAGSLPFAIGAAIYHLPARRLPRWGLALATALFAINVFCATAIWSDPFNAGLCASLALSGLLLQELKSATPPWNWLGRLDRIAGDLAYPIFLGHMVVFAFVIGVFFGHTRPEYDVLMLATFVPINVLAFALHTGIVARIEPLRARIGRRRATPVASVAGPLEGERATGNA